MPLKVIDSPYREITKPVLDYVRRMRTDAPRDVVTVFIPEYVVGHWWEQLLHNQTALRLKGRLLFQPGCDGHQRAVAAEFVGTGEARRRAGGTRRRPPWFHRPK